MPQIQPGQVVPGANGAPKLYGVDKPQNNVPFQQKLFDLFKPHEFVTIKNIDDEAVYWQYMPEDKEQIDYDESGLQKMIHREQPEMWVIGSGETEVLVGASAYRALDAIYKNWAAKSTLRKFRDPTQPQFNEKNEHLPKNFNFADDGAQHEFIKHAYIGKAVPTFGNSGVVQEVTAIPSVELPSSSVVATSQELPQVQPMQAAVPEVDPTIPKPKTSEGAPLAPVTYADPGSDAKAVKAAKSLVK